MALVRTLITVVGATLASRVLGFVRDTVIAATLGTGAAADAFFVAFRLPNLFRRLFAEGAFSAAFVPIYARLVRERGEVAAHRFAGEALAALALVLAVLSAGAIVFAPELIDLLAPGFRADTGKRELAIRLARVCFPYLACIAVVALLSGMSTVRRAYLVPALAPVVLNLVLIAALAGFTLFGGGDRSAAAGVLSIAVVVAGVAQVVLLVGALIADGVLPPLARPRLSPEIRDLARLGLPGLLAGAVGEINVVVGTVIASTTAGAVSWLYYADRVYQLPLGVVGIAVGQVLLPEILHARHAEGEAAGHAVLNRVLEFALSLTLAAALALGLLADPIVSVLFERGAFTYADRLASGSALALFAVGLPGFVLVRVLSPVFFAREDTTTPAVLGGLAVAVNVATSLALMPVMGWLAVAIGTSAAGWFNAVALGAVAARRGLFGFDADLRRRLPRLALAAAAMAVVVGAAHHGLDGAFAAGVAFPTRAAALSALVGLGLAVFTALVLALGVLDPGAVRRLLRSRAAPADEASCDRPADRA